jgi:hypothetical protein
MTNVISLILDTGASISVSNCIADFVTPIRPVQHTTLQGIAAGLAIKGLGTVQYSVLNDTGGLVTLTIPEVLFVPDCPSRLIFPRQLLISMGDTNANMRVQANGVQLWFGGSTITIPYHGRSFLPVLHTTPTLACYHAYCSAHTAGQLSSPSLEASLEIPSLLSPAQQVKHSWHCRLNHVNFDQLTKWMRLGLVPASKEVINAPAPVCAACNYGKAQRRSRHSSTGIIGGGPKLAYLLISWKPVAQA